MKIFIALVFFFAGLSASKEFEGVYIKYKAQDYNSAFESFKILADNGDLEAAHILATMYENGEGCEIDDKEAIKWYKFSSKGYYNQSKDNFTREVDKKKQSLYKSLDKSQDKETDETIRRYTQSLYNIKAHHANYFLPISHRDSGVYAPTNGHNAQSTETEFQLSIKYDFAPNLLGLDEIYTLAYTQLSFWQLYSSSAYFRETNYNPEFFVTIPSSKIYESQYIKAFQFSLAHESNGRGGVEERSWNSLNATVFFQYKSLFTELKIWKRLSDATDYNPALIDYIDRKSVV